MGGAGVAPPRAPGGGEALKLSEEVMKGMNVLRRTVGALRTVGAFSVERPEHHQVGRVRHRTLRSDSPSSPSASGASPVHRGPETHGYRKPSEPLSSSYNCHSI